VVTFDISFFHFVQEILLLLYYDFIFPSGDFSNISALKSFANFFLQNKFDNVIYLRLCFFGDLPFSVLNNDVFLKNRRPPSKGDDTFYDTVKK